MILIDVDVDDDTFKVLPSSILVNDINSSRVTTTTHRYPKCINYWY